MSLLPFTIEFSLLSFLYLKPIPPRDGKWGGNPLHSDTAEWGCGVRNSATAVKSSDLASALCSLYSQKLYLSTTKYLLLIFIHPLALSWSCLIISNGDCDCYEIPSNNNNAIWFNSFRKIPEVRKMNNCLISFYWLETTPEATTGRFILPHYKMLPRLPFGVRRTCWSNSNEFSD